MTTYMLQGYGLKDPCTLLADALLEQDPPIGTVATSSFEQELPTWRVEAYYEYEPDEAELAAFIAQLVGADALKWKIIPLDDENWVAKGLEDLPPVKAGRYVVFGAHDVHKVPLNAIGLHIEASAAFGTGHHHTTRGCLLALEWLVKQQHKLPLSPCGRGCPERAGEGDSSLNFHPHPSLRDTFSRQGRRVRIKNILDLGTGTGVLGFAALKSCARSKAVLSDNDPDSVRIAKENAAFNRVKSRSTIVVASGTQTAAIRTCAPYDLIFANILAPVLVILAGDIARVTAQNGYVVLSGLLNWQARRVFGSYAARGFVMAHKVVLGDWTTLVLRKR